MILIYHWLDHIQVSTCYLADILNVNIAILVLGRSIAVHVSNGADIMACSNIEPAVLSDTSLRLSFPDLPSDTVVK